MKKKRIKISILTALLALFVSYVLFGVCAEADSPAMYSGKPGKVTGITAVDVTASALTLTWDQAENADSYVVYRYIPSSGRYVRKGTVSENKLRLTKLKSGAIYVFSVRACRKESGKSIYGEYSDRFSVPVKPAQVKKVKVSGTEETTASLTWKKQKNTTGYVVYRYIASSGRYVKKATVSQNSATVKKLKSGVRYTFCVRAYREVHGKRVYGAYSEFIYPVTKPAVVKDVKASEVTDSSAKLTWTHTKKRTGYTVYRYDPANGTYAKWAETSKNRYSAKELESGKQYIFSVRPYRTISGTRTYGGFSENVTVNVKPGNVTGLNAASVQENAVKLSWNKAAGAARYRVYVRKKNAWKLLGTVKKPSYTAKGLNSGTEYTFSVRAYYKKDDKRIFSPSRTELKVQTQRPGRSIYLTFDDGPSSVTEYALDALDQYGAKAVFFVTYQPGYENVLRDIVARGHGIGIHTASHEYSQIYSSFAAWHADFMKAYNFVVSVTGVHPDLYRFPGGSITSHATPEVKAQIKQWLSDNGFAYYDWNLLTGDGDPNVDLNQGYADVVNNAARRNVPVILMHDGGYNNRTITILPAILKTLTEQGFRFDLLTREVPPIHQGEHWDYQYLQEEVQ